MPRAFSQEVYAHLLSGETVKLSDLSWREYETIRTGLYRNHRTMIEIGGTEYSILARFANGEAFFRLGPRKKGRSFSIQIVDDAQVPGTLEQNSEERNSYDHLPQDG